MIFSDLHKLCRLCFQNEGENDVTTVPFLLDTIKDLYNIQIKNTDKYTKLICQKCTDKIQKFSWHKRVVDSAQVLFAQRIQMAEQMNHIKIDPDANTEAPFDDMMTEVDIEMSANESGQNRIDRAKNDKQDALRISRRRATMVVENLSKSTSEVKQKGANVNLRHEHTASRIKTRRATMAAGRLITPDSRLEKRNNNKSKTEERTQPIDERRSIMSMKEENQPKTSRKRRLSHSQSNGIEDKSVIRNHSDSRKETIENKAKKIRPNESLSHKHSSSKLSLTSDRSRYSDSTSTSTSTKPTSDKHSSTYAKPSHTKHRDKKFKASSTPPITQFFAQATLKCSTCSVILKSQKELDFHLSIHEKGQCTECHQYIKSDHADAVQMHMISCLFLDNELSADYLSHLLKVKVDVNRLTSTKIDEIRKNLGKAAVSSNEASNNVDHESERNESCAMETANEKIDQKELISPEALDHPVERTNEKGKEKLADGEKSKKSKSKKTPIKSKPSYSEENKELTIKDNQSAAIMWNDETTMNKLFMYRNFESDKPVYIQIKPVLGAGCKNLSDDRFEQLLQCIRAVKEQALVAENPRKLAAIMNSANSPIINNSIENENRLAMNNTIRSATHHGISNVNVNDPPIVNEIIHMTPALQVVHNTSIVSKSPQLLEPPRIGFTKPMNSPKQMGSAKPANTPNQVNVPILMQNSHKLVPIRNRAMSMHLSAPGYLPTTQLIAIRRQSVCEKNAVTPVNLSNGDRNNLSQLSQPIQLSVSTSPLIPKNGSHSQSPMIMTKIHHAEFVQQQPNPNCNVNKSSIVCNIPRINQLKVLTPEDLNLRAVNYCQPAVDGNPNPRIDSPSSMENVDNNNHNVKRPRTKTTPVRNQPQQISDDANVSISISLTRLETNQVELTFSAPNIGKIKYDTLTTKRKQEIRSSLLKNDVWKKMLHFLKQIPPTNDTLRLFREILPPMLNDEFFNELKKVYGNRSG